MVSCPDVEGGEGVNMPPLTKLGMYYATSPTYWVFIENYVTPTLLQLYSDHLDYPATSEGLWSNLPQANSLESMLLQGNYHLCAQ